MSTTTIRPGILVALRSSVEGGVYYSRRDLDAQGAYVNVPVKVEEGASAAVTRWETVKVTEDPAEHERATKARNAAITAIGRVCSRTTFGLLCPRDAEGALDAAIREAREIVEAHNATARHTRVRVYALKGRIADTDEQAARAIGAEVASLITEMSRAIDKLDPKAVRRAADQARELAAMLTEEQRGKVDAAIEQARKAARQIVARVEKKGEEAAIVLADVQRGSIERARIAFLDMSEEPKTTAPEAAMPAAELGRFGQLDLNVDAANAEPAANAPRADLDLDDDAPVTSQPARLPRIELAPAGEAA